MAKFRKKPVVIDAEVYRPGLEDGVAAVFRPECGHDSPTIAMAVHPVDKLDCYLRSDYVDRALVEAKASSDPELMLMPFIKTLEGIHFITEGDYIITGVKGERYPCKPDIFEATYEPAE